MPRTTSTQLILVRALIRRLQPENDSATKEAALLSLAFLASGDAVMSVRIMCNVGVRRLCCLLSDRGVLSNSKLRTYAAYTLAVMAYASPSVVADSIRDMGGVWLLSKAMHSSNETACQQAAAEALVHCLRIGSTTDAARCEAVIAGAVESLMRMVSACKAEIREVAIYLLASIAMGPELCRAALAEAGTEHVLRLVSLHPNTQRACMAANCAVGNICGRPAVCCGGVSGSASSDKHLEERIDVVLTDAERRNIHHNMLPEWSPSKRWRMYHLL